MLNTSKKVFLIVAEINFFFSHRYDLIKELAQRGWEFNIIGYSGDLIPKSEKNINYIFINSNRERFGILNLIINVRKLSKEISLHDPNLIYAISHRSILLSCLSSLLTKKKSIYAITGMGSVFTPNKFFFKKFFLKILKLILFYTYRLLIKQKYSSFILQNSDDLDLLVANKIAQRNNSHIIPGNGLPKKYFSSTVSSNKNFKFVMVSRILRDKGVIEYLLAANNVSKDFPECEFELYGSFDHNNPQSITLDDIKHYLSPKIIYKGFEKNIRDKLIESNVLVLPSYREGFARVLMEAQACSRPVITSNIPGCKDVIIENKTGLLTEPMDVSGIEKNMKYFLKNPQQYLIMSKNSFKHAMDNFSINQAADYHEEIFNKILSD
tara:strand:- start:1977 stop:3119 length:1143 start_codon:yes stop_codon:yes gene_type:complete